MLYYTKLGTPKAMIVTIRFLFYIQVLNEQHRLLYTVLACGRLQERLRATDGRGEAHLEIYISIIDMSSM